MAISKLLFSINMCQFVLNMKVLADFTDDDSDYDSMPELVSDHEDDNSARVGQRTGVMRPRSIRV